MKKLTVGGVKLEIEGSYTVTSVQLEYPDFDDWDGRIPPTISKGTVFEFTGDDQCELEGLYGQPVEDLRINRQGIPIIVVGGKKFWIGNIQDAYESGELRIREPRKR